MIWIALAVLIVVGWVIYSKRKGSVTLSKDQALLVRDLVSKEREELCRKMHDTVDEGALEGKTVSVDSIFKYTQDMTPEERQHTEAFKAELLEKYGPTIPVNISHRLLREIEGHGQMWSDKPGCFERHLQRRDGSLLFSRGRRIVTRKEIEEARQRDGLEQQRFAEKARTFADGIVGLQETKMSLDRATEVLKELQELLEEAASIGGDISYPVQTLENTEEALQRSMAEAFPDGAALLKQAQSQSILKRAPYFAQVTRKDSPIPPEEEVPSLLSEDLATISFHGFVSMAFGPSFRPSDTDIRSHLKQAVGQGFSKERAVKIIAAWDEGRSKGEKAEK